MQIDIAVEIVLSIIEPHRASFGKDMMSINTMQPSCGRPQFAIESQTSGPVTLDVIRLKQT